MKEKITKISKSKFDYLYQQAEKLPPIKMAVVCPHTKEPLQGAIIAAKEGSIEPILIGDAKQITKVAKEIGEKINFRIIDTTEEEASRKAVQMARAGEVGAIIKGSLHTDTLMAEIVNGASGLRTAKRMSHCMVVDVPSYHKLLIISDAALNIQPNLAEKQSIVQNAIDLALALGIKLPKVALISAVETITDRIPNTIECAALCKMAERGQIKGGILDGPLAFDLAVSKEAVLAKKMVSQVAGDPDIIVIPNIETGNVLVKALDDFADALSLGIILGAKVPVIITSRSASAISRAGSCMLAKLSTDFTDLTDCLK
jgi:phosphate acetyltransferase